MAKMMMPRKIIAGAEMFAIPMTTKPTAIKSKPAMKVGIARKFSATLETNTWKIMMIQPVCEIVSPRMRRVPSSPT